MQTMYEKIVEYLEKRSYVSYKKMYADLTYGGRCNKESFYRAWQDLKVSGRIQFGAEDSIRINL